MSKALYGFQRTVFLSAAVAAAMMFMACDTKKALVLQFDGGTAAPDRAISDYLATPLEVGPGFDTTVDPCAGGGCDWCAQDECPELCAAGQCNKWAPNVLDHDTDGILDADDNCLILHNPSQHNSDSDKFGDTCDVCPHDADPAQLDTDGDGQGDACDEDADNDGVANVADNCPLVPNIMQYASDNDEEGDACDEDADGDGVSNLLDNCPLVPNPDQDNGDPNTHGDACDRDQDGDNIQDSIDNCPGVANDTQLDMDGDHRGDSCDADQDGDGVSNLQDNCPLDSNPAQENQDRDRLGDACDLMFCVVIPAPESGVNEDVCLDPTEMLKVHVPALNLRLGSPLVLPLYVNRAGMKISYSWAVAHRPAGSKVEVIGAAGECFTSELFACLYEEPAPAGFVADAPGSYTLRVTVDLQGQDPVNPAWPTSASAETTVTVSGAGTVCIPDRCFK